MFAVCARRFSSKSRQVLLRQRPILRIVSTRNGVFEPAAAAAMSSFLTSSRALPGRLANKSNEALLILRIIHNGLRVIFLFFFQCCSSNSQYNHLFYSAQLKKTNNKKKKNCLYTDGPIQPRNTWLILVRYLRGNKLKCNKNDLQQLVHLERTSRNLRKCYVIIQLRRHSTIS